jgi:hypothetical protein
VDNDEDELLRAGAPSLGGKQRQAPSCTLNGRFTFLSDEIRGALGNKYPTFRAEIWGMGVF